LRAGPAETQTGIEPNIFLPDFRIQSSRLYKQRLPSSSAVRFVENAMELLLHRSVL
jgi:hypothetical protein